MAIDPNLLNFMFAGQALQGLGGTFINGERLRRGQNPLDVGGVGPGHIMNLMQMQQKQQQQAAAQKAIAGLEGIDPNVRTLLSLFPEETASAYVKNATDKDPQKSPFLNTGGALYNQQTGEWLLPPNAGEKPVIKEFAVGDQTVTAAINPATGEVVREISRAPRWNPKSGAAGGGQMYGLGQMQLVNEEVTLPDGSKQIVQRPYSVIPQRGGAPIVQPMQLPGQDEAIVKSSTPAGDTLTAAQKNDLGSIAKQSAIVDEAIKRVDGNPGAFDPAKGAALYSAYALGGDPARSLAERKVIKNDKDIEDRALLYNQVSRVIHEIAGQAQSAGEAERILKWLPGDTDSATQIKAKMRALKSDLSIRKKAIEDLGRPQIAAPPQPQLVAPPPTAAVPPPVLPQQVQPAPAPVLPPTAAAPAPRRIKVDAKGNLIQ